MVLRAAEGVGNQQIDVCLGWSMATAYKWRQRFVEHRIAAIYDELRPVPPRCVSDEQVAALVSYTFKRKTPAENARFYAMICMTARSIIMRMSK